MWILVRLVPAPLVALLLVLPTPRSSSAQSVVVDQGTFALRIDGQDAGSEEFTIRRAGLGADATIIAHGVVDITLEDGTRELRPMLQAVPSEGVATGYQLKISGAETTELNMTLAGRRYVSILHSERGEEEREFLARPGTRVVEAWVAHQYYFLRGLAQGDEAWIIEPRTRSQLALTVTEEEQDELTVAGSRVPTRKLTLTDDTEVRRVWFDDQGRVIRLEVPGWGYVAQRQDLVG